MNFKSSAKTVQSAQESQTTANWLDCIVEELSDEVAAAVVGGKKSKTTSTALPNALIWYSDATQEQIDLMNVITGG